MYTGEIFKKTGIASFNTIVKVWLCCTIMKEIIYHHCVYFNITLYLH